MVDQGLIYHITKNFIQRAKKILYKTKKHPHFLHRKKESFPLDTKLLW